MEFFHKKTSFPFMATRKVWYTLSAVLMVVRFASFFTRGLNFAIDFTGGISVEAAFPQDAKTDTIREAVEAAGYHEPQVQTFGSTRDVTIRLQSTGESAEVLRPKFETILCARSIPKVVISDLAVVGPQVGDELRYSAIVSLAVTLVLIALYIMLRFHTWRLSLGAILAVMHDPILVLGVFSVTQTPFDLAGGRGHPRGHRLFVERHRHRVRPHPRKLREAIAAWRPTRRSTHAINQTLSRTIMTKVVTSIVVVALLLLGGSALRGFSEALLIGIIAGTYSSIYISSAIALSCGLKAEHLFPTVRKDPIDELP